MENKPKKSTDKENLDKESLDKSLKILVKTSFIVFIGVVLSKILAYAYRVIIARTFGPEVYGLYSLAITILALFMFSSSFGLADGLLRFIPIYRAKNEKDKIRHIVKRSLIISLFSGVVGGILLFILSDFIAISLFHNPALSPFLKIFSFLIVIFLFSGVFLNSLRAYEKIAEYSFVFNIIQNLVKLIALILLIFLGFKIHSVIFSHVLGILSMLIGSYLFCKYKLPEIFGVSRLKEKKAVNNEFFSYSWPFMFYSIISVIFYWIDSFSIGYYRDATAVGFYNAAVPIAMLLTLVPDLFVQLFFPLINREHSKNNHELIKQLSKQVTKWIFIINLPIFIILFCFPGAALNVLFGSDYLVASMSLKILLISSLISSTFTISTQLISMIGKSKLVLLNIILASMLNFALNSIFVPMDTILSLDNSLGIVGAAIATMISVIFFNFLFLVQTKKYLSFIPLRIKMVRILVISIIPAILLFYLRSIVEINFLSIVLLSGIFFFLYFALILITKCFDENDWMIIKSFKNKLVSLKDNIKL